MKPIKVVFQSKESIVVYSEDVTSFSESVLTVKPPEIKHLEIIDTDEDVPELAEVKMTLRSGASMLCYLAKSDMPRASFIREIADCEGSNAIAYSKLALKEQALDDRLTAVGAFVNNIPDLDVRLAVHTEYLKRKQAYASALEALVDGVIRRPNE
jgi:hypothetical protein